jgi:hypothetical protein
MRLPWAAGKAGLAWRVEMATAEGLEMAAGVPETVAAVLARVAAAAAAECRPSNKSRRGRRRAPCTSRS